MEERGHSFWREPIAAHSSRNQRSYASAVWVTIAGLAMFPASTGILHAQQNPVDSSRVRFGVFIDTYYAFDFNRPPGHDRAFTTQSVRHNEFNVNLAFVEATLDSKRVRGRVAVQAGTSVQANYTAEPRVGTISGPDLSRFLQEARVGLALNQSLWMDAGIFLSSFGSEGWISRDNWTYTRSLVAEFSPYYESGLKLTWNRSSHLSAEGHLLNGWQNVSENNSAKALGFRVDYSPSPRFAFGFDVFAGNENPDSSRAVVRVWNDAIVTVTPFTHAGVRATLDYGRQKIASGENAVWWGYSIVGRYEPTARVTLSARGEHFEDLHQVVVLTGSDLAFRGSGWSAGFDLRPDPRLFCRFEFRQLTASSAVFPAINGFSGGDRLLVGSAALTF